MSGSDYYYQDETTAGGGQEQFLWLWGALIVLAVLFCGCIVCGLVSAFVYLDRSDGGLPEPTPTQSQPPQPVIAYPAEGIVGQPVPFDGSSSLPGSSPIVGYDWDFGDGSTGPGAITSHTYSSPGNFAVTLTVTGQDGLRTISGAVQITIKESASPNPAATPGQ